MTRTVINAVEDAILDNISHKEYVKARISPGRAFFGSVLDSNGVGLGPDTWSDSPVPQDVSYSPQGDKLVSWYNASGTLKYSVQGNSTLVSTGLSITGKPGAAGDYVYRLNGTTITKHTVDWSAVAGLSGSPFSASATIGTTQTGTNINALCVCGVDSTHCIVVYEWDGGLRGGMWSGTTEYRMPTRFMFPIAIAYSSGSIGGGRSYASLANFSGAIGLDGDAYLYISNNWNGSVQGVKWDGLSHAWGDIFTAIPTDNQTGFCEFRVANAYTYGGRGYLVGQFRRTENVETTTDYSLVCATDDGHNFSMDATCLVSNLGYRFLGISGGGNFFIGNCGLVSSGSAPYTFDGNNGGHYIDIPGTSIVEYTDDSLSSGSLQIAVSDAYYVNHPFVTEQAKVEVWVGYDITGGSPAYTLYGTYILDSKNPDFRDGQATLSLRLTNEATWKLTGLTSPFYTEIFSKSSIYDPMTPNFGNMYVASNMGRREYKYSFDFWDAEPYDLPAQSIVGIKVASKGGVSYYRADGNHILGLKTKDLMATGNFVDYPKITDTEVHSNLFGWSRDASGGTTNDIVDTFILVKSQTTGEISFHKSGDGLHWPNTYPSNAAGDLPVSNIIYGLTPGDRIVAVGILFLATHDTIFCPARVELNDGVRMIVPFNDANTPWESTEAYGYRLPKTCRPYMMFSQKPFNAFNFTASANFDCSITGAVDTFEISGGVVGLALDGSSYILAEYDHHGTAIDLYMIRDFSKRGLMLGTPTGVTITSTFSVMLKHTDGLFRVFLGETNGPMVEQFQYEWSQDNGDGWMFESTTATMKTGIYGYAHVPSFRIVGLDMGSHETLVNADSIPCLPGGEFELADFPTSGSPIVQIDDVLYSYTGISAEPDPIRGPYQFRQNGQYPPSDNYALEHLDFHWSQTTLFGDCIVALDDGCNFLISSILWKVPDGSGGYLHRSRVFSENTQIANVDHTLGTRVYITTGLTGITQVQGTYKRHIRGSVAHKHLEGELYCKWFMGSSGDLDITVHSLVDHFSKLSGAKSRFRDLEMNDWDISSLTTVGSMDYVEAIDLTLDTNGIAIGDSVYVETNIAIDDVPGSTGSRCRIYRFDSTHYHAIFYSLPSATSFQTAIYVIPEEARKFRFIFHDNYYSLYMNDSWLQTFGVNGLVYPTTVFVSLDGDFHLNQAKLYDLSDWRDAIYIDLETDGRSAVQSVLQERPVEQLLKSDGSIQYVYEPPAFIVGSGDYLALQHSFTTSVPRDSASDAIVYGSKNVKGLQHSPYAINIGFSTKVMRFPNLNIGAVRAAKILLKKLEQRKIMHTVTIRPDIRVEVGDNYQTSYEASTGETRNIDIIVEGVSLSFRSGSRTMQVSGRERD